MSALEIEIPAIRMFFLCPQAVYSRSGSGDPSRTAAHFHPVSVECTIVEIFH